MVGQEEQRFCDSCRWYEDPERTGEGYCGALGTETWNGEYACEEYFEDRRAEDGTEAMR